MADSTTTTYSFTLPEVGASADSWGTKLNANWSKVDDLFDGTVAVTGINLTTFKVDSVIVTASAAELNKLDGLTATTTELNYVDGVTSNIQTQLDSMVEKSGDTMTGDLSLGDNVKAKFGAGDDLQIYHDGSNSYIKDSGTGGLIVQARDAITFEDGITGENYLYMQRDGKVEAYYDGSAKLATTSTGVDVTGTVTTDGLTVKTTSPSIHITGADTSQQLIYFGGTTSDEKGAIRYSDNSDWMQFETDSVKRVRIDSGGDVSFYEDTGTTAKMVWDASAESLGIGRANPRASLDFGVPTLSSTLSTTLSDYQVMLEAPSGTGNYAHNIGWSESTGSAVTVASINAVDDGSSSATGITFATGDNSSITERLRIDSSGNVGIGRTNPSSYVTDDESLYVKGQIRVDGITNTASVPALAIDDTNSGIFSPAANTLGFSTAAAERARIDSSGNLLVGTSTSPTTNASSGNVVGSIFSSSSHTVANVSSSYVNSGFSIGNTRASYLVTVSGGAANNGSTLATYIFTKAAYDAELVQLGNTASHYNNVTIEAGLSSVSASTVELRVRFGGSNLTGTGTITTNAIRIG